MPRRSHERIAAYFKARFSCHDIDYSGTVRNLSEKGMLLETDELYFPFDSKFEVTIHHQDNSLQVPVRLNRVVLSPGAEDSIGVEVTDPSPDYLQFVGDLRNNMP